jgi:thioredoxin-related protein
MLRLLLIFLFPLIQLFPTWESNFDVAKQRSIKESKIILIHFVHKTEDSKNVKLEKETFETNEFAAYANNHLVLLKIDLGVDQTSSEKQFSHNSIIRERYNSGAIAPFTIITDADGKVLKTWNYKQPLNSSELISSIQTTIEANKQ